MLGAKQVQEVPRGTGGFKIHMYIFIILHSWDLNENIWKMNKKNASACVSISLCVCRFSSTG